MEAILSNLDLNSVGTAFGAVEGVAAAAAVALGYYKSYNDALKYLTTSKTGVNFIDKLYNRVSKGLYNKYIPFSVTKLEKNIAKNIQNMIDIPANLNVTRIVHETKKMGDIRGKIFQGITRNQLLLNENLPINPTTTSGTLNRFNEIPSRRTKMPAYNRYALLNYTGRRGRYNNYYNNRYRSYSRSYRQRKYKRMLQQGAVSNSKKVTLKRGQAEVLTTNAGIAGNSYLINSCESMNPLGWNQWENFYEHYCVIAVRIKIHMTNLTGDAHIVGINLSEGGTGNIPASIRNGLEISEKTCLLGAQGANNDSCVMTLNVCPHKFLGRSKPLSDSQLIAAKGSDPTEKVYFNYWGEHDASTTSAGALNGISVKLEFEMDVVLLHPNQVLSTST